MWAQPSVTLIRLSLFCVEGYGPPKRKLWPCAEASMRESLAYTLPSLLRGRLPLGQQNHKGKGTKKDADARGTKADGGPRNCRGYHGGRWGQRYMELGTRMSADSMAGRSLVYGRYTSVDNEDQKRAGRV